MTNEFTFQQIGHYPAPGTEGPRRFSFSKDSQNLLYTANQPGSPLMQLWRYEPASGQPTQLTNFTENDTTENALSLAERLWRERTRTRDLGVTEIQQAGEGAKATILIKAGDRRFVSSSGGPFEEITICKGVSMARLSGDGQQIAFARGGNLYRLNLAEPDKPQQLTSDGGQAGIANGVAEYVAQEEMGRLDGFWWSPDSKQIAFTRVNNTPTGLFPIVHLGQQSGLDLLEEEYYPFAGGTNAAVELGVLRLAENGVAPAVTWLNLHPDKNAPLTEHYLTGVEWQSNERLIAQVETRDQKTLQVLAFDPASGQRQLVLEEKGQPWLNLPHSLTFLENGQILLDSERDGFRHLYLLDEKGQVIRQLTNGEWQVNEVARLDEANRLVYFTGNRESPLEQHLYVVSLDGGELRRLTAEAGWHEVSFSGDGAWLVESWHNTSQPLTVRLYKVDTQAANPLTQLVTLYQNPTSLDALGLQPPQMINLAAEDGTLLYGAVYRPANLEEGQRYPLIVSVYGGPAAQAVTNSWNLSGDLRAQALARAGFVVLKLDNRGSTRRGVAFESVVAGRFGETELRDQIAGIKYLAEQGYVDENRVGIYGWSYGGYMTLIALLKAPDIFKVGVAGAPPTFWQGYDTFYTERYLGHPAQNAAGYAQSDALPLAGNLQGKLLLVHGQVDENVHYRHSVALMERLAALGKEFDLLVLPEERHAVRQPANKTYLEQRLIGFFKQNL